jgi:hypothetical protein
MSTCLPRQLAHLAQNSEGFKYNAADCKSPTSPCLMFRESSNTNLQPDTCQTHITVVFKSSDDGHV